MNLKPGYSLSAHWEHWNGSVLLMIGTGAALDDGLGIARCSPKWTGEVLKILKRIPLFKFDFHSGLKIFGSRFSKSCLSGHKFQVHLAVNTTLECPDSLSQSQHRGGQMLLQDKILSLCLHSPCLDFNVSFSRICPNQLEFCPHPWLRQLTAVFKNVFLEGSGVVFH